MSAFAKARAVANATEFVADPVGYCDRLNVEVAAMLGGEPSACLSDAYRLGVACEILERLLAGVSL